MKSRHAVREEMKASDLNPAGVPWLLFYERRPAPTVVELAHVVGDALPAPGDLDPESESLFRRCLCGCDLSRAHCDKCGRLESSLANPLGARVYWLCEDCRAEWERTGKTSD